MGSTCSAEEQHAYDESDCEIDKRFPQKNTLSPSSSLGPQLAENLEAEAEYSKNSDTVVMKLMVPKEVFAGLLSKEWEQLVAEGGGDPNDPPVLQFSKLGVGGVQGQAEETEKDGTAEGERSEATSACNTLRDDGTSSPPTSPMLSGPRQRPETAPFQPPRQARPESEPSSPSRSALKPDKSSSLRWRVSHSQQASKGGVRPVVATAEQAKSPREAKSPRTELPPPVVIPSTPRALLWPSTKYQRRRWTPKKNPGDSLVVASDAEAPKQWTFRGRGKSQRVMVDVTITPKHRTDSFQSPHRRSKTMPKLVTPVVQAKYMEEEAEVQRMHAEADEKTKLKEQLAEEEAKVKEMRQELQAERIKLEDDIAEVEGLREKLIKAQSSQFILESSMTKSDPAQSAADLFEEEAKIRYEEDAKVKRMKYEVQQERRKLEEQWAELEAQREKHLEGEKRLSRQRVELRNQRERLDREAREFEIASHTIFSQKEEFERLKKESQERGSKLTTQREQVVELKRRLKVEQDQLKTDRDCLEQQKIRWASEKQTTGLRQQLRMDKKVEVQLRRLQLERMEFKKEKKKHEDNVAQAKAVLEAEKLAFASDRLRVQHNKQLIMEGTGKLSELKQKLELLKTLREKNQGGPTHIRHVI